MLARADSVVYAVGCVVSFINQERRLVRAGAMGEDLLTCMFSVGCGTWRRYLEL